MFEYPELTTQEYYEYVKLVQPALPYFEEIAARESGEVSHNYHNVPSLRVRFVRRDTITCIVSLQAVVTAQHGPPEQRGAARYEFHTHYPRN